MSLLRLLQATLLGGQLLLQLVAVAFQVLDLLTSGRVDLSSPIARIYYHKSLSRLSRLSHCSLEIFFFLLEVRAVCRMRRRPRHDLSRAVLIGSLPVHMVHVDDLAIQRRCTSSGTCSSRRRRVCLELGVGLLPAHVCCVIACDRRAGCVSRLGVDDFDGELVRIIRSILERLRVRGHVRIRV